MPKNRIHKGNEECFYFITPTIQNWYYIFDRHNRWQIIADCIKFCQKHKGLEVYSYVFMLNHLYHFPLLITLSGEIFLRIKFTRKTLVYQDIHMVFLVNFRPKR